MPHKHKRRQNDNDYYDLPPTVVAKPLPARDPNTKSKATGKTKKEEKARQAQKFEKKTKAELDDDTPRAFRQLLQYQAKFQQPNKQQQRQQQEQPEGKKRKRGARDSPQDDSTRKKKPGNDPETDTTAAATPKVDPKTLPQILPGEKLSDFAARVDREMPLSEMKRTMQVATLPNGTKIREQRLTKHDKRLRRLQSQWREDDEKIKEREAIEREEREAEMEDQLDLWKQWETEAGKSKAKKKAAASKKKKKSKGKNNGDAGSGDDDDYDDSDPWAKLNKPERLNKAANPLDVVQAPPQLTKPKEKFKVRGGAKVNVDNVPTAMGSLRRREELADERKNIVEEYRRLMAEKRQ